MSRSRLHRSENRSVSAGAGGWDGLSMTGVVPPHGYQYMNRAGVSVTDKTVLGIGVVQRCLEVIQNAFFVMGNPRAYRLAFDKDGLPYSSYIPQTNSQYPSVLNSPWGTSPFADNAPVIYSTGIGRTVASMGFFGEAWWLITARDYYGNASALEPLHPSFLDTRGDGTMWYGIGSQQVEVDPADLVHIPRLIMPGDRAGLSPIKYEAPIFAIAIAAVQYSQMWFAQGASPSYILSTDQKLTPDDMDKIFEKILLEKSGMNNAYAPLILDSGVKAQVVQSDPDKSQMDQTLTFVRAEITGYFGIPAHLAGGVGDQGNVWGKGIQEQNFSLVDFTLSGYRCPIQEAFSSIIPRGQLAEITPRQLLRANSESVAKTTIANRQSAVTSPNEERRDQGLPPVPGGDSITTPMNSNIPAGAGVEGESDDGSGDGGGTS